MTVSSQGASGGEGPRTVRQVLANSAVASVLILLHAYQLHQRKIALVNSLHRGQDTTDAGSLCFSWGGDLLVVGIIANYACVAADTFSSELGILSRSQPRLITSPTLRRVPRGTNGGVTPLGLGAGLLGSMIIVAASMFFLPLCTEETAGKLGGGVNPWTVEQRRLLMVGLTICGVLGSVLDSFLGGFFQRSVKDVRSGRIVEGEGGQRVLVSAAAEPVSGKQFESGASIRAKLLSGEGKDAVESVNANVGEGSDAETEPSNRYDPRNKHRRASFGDERPSRVVESGWDLLDNNEVNFMMALIMSTGAMGVAGWYWGVPMNQIFQGW